MKESGVGSKHQAERSQNVESGSSHASEFDSFRNIELTFVTTNRLCQKKKKTLVGEGENNDAPVS